LSALFISVSFAAAGQNIAEFEIRSNKLACGFYGAVHSCATNFVQWPNWPVKKN
jgi:hypothetical protein